MARQPTVKVEYFYKVIFVHMFKFLSGVATGWVAARVLPPKPPEISPLSLPSAADISILAGYANKAFEHIEQRINHDKENKTSN